MKKYALTGHPLGHSLSPLIHKRLFELSGKTDCVYTLCEIDPGKFGDSSGILREFDGFNVTIPYKTEVIRMIDRLDGSAERYNAVNCVKNSSGVLTGYNTDCDGFLRSAETLPLGGNVLLLGCGGAGRMMATEAVLHGASLTIAIRPRSVRKARLLTDEILSKCGGADVKIADINRIEGHFDVLLNATPVGMYPNTDECPVSDEVIENCLTFFDAIYNPTETQLIRKARSMGKTAVGGAAMLVHQAVRAHEIWDGSTYEASGIAGIISETEKAADEMQKEHAV